MEATGTPALRVATCESLATGPTGSWSVTSKKLATGPAVVKNFIILIQY
jgi:hypothetical protein